MTTATATASFTRLADDSWGIQGFDLVEGQPVVIVKRDGARQDAVVGAIVTPCNKWGKTVARIARPERKVNADKVTEVGFYLHDEVVYKVVASKTSGRLYAKKVTARGFEYDGGAIFKLAASEKMTAEEVRVWSRTTGICANCSAELSDPVSVEIGLGTHCGPAILGSEAYKAARKAAKLVPAVAEALAKIKAEKAAEKALVAAAQVVDEVVTPALDRLLSQPVGQLDADEEAFRQGWEEASLF